MGITAIYSGFAHLHKEIEILFLNINNVVPTFKDKNEYDKDTFIEMVAKKTNETKENIENWFDKQFEKK